MDELEWKVSEMKKLLMSRDMDVCSCAFHEEQAFLSSLPLVSMEKHLYERSKRNALTTGVASCYPFTSYELSDENGILFGLNKYNNSPVIIDIFDSKVYKNANIAVCGTSGAGKTFLILLMALRMRRKGIQVFMLAPLKGHEFHRACVNTGGEFISISPASKSCINVLEIRKVDKSVEEMLDGPGIERSELAAKIQRLHIFFALLIPDMSYEEKQLLDEAAKCSDESDMNDLIESKWDSLISDVTLSQKQHYSKELKQVNREYIHTYCAKGQTFNKKFKLDKTKTAKMIEKIWEKKAYQSAQNSTSSTSSTENKGTVWIYNGSKITGLAAKYQKILQEDGYEVKGVGNATGNIRSQTVIYATKKKKANALKKYFKNPLIQTADNMSSGASIEIVLGTDDDIQ